MKLRKYISIMLTILLAVLATSYHKTGHWLFAALTIIDFVWLSCRIGTAISAWLDLAEIREDSKPL